MLAIAAAGFFSWGYLAHREQLFPYSLVRFAAVQLGFVPEATTVDIEARRRDLQPAVAPLGALTSLPYVQSLFDPDSLLRGVVIFDSARAEPGVNFYNSYASHRAHLIDMRGDTLHEWTYPYPGGFWHHAELLDDGSLQVVIKDLAILKLNRCSNLVWSRETRAHHDVWVDGDRRIYLLTRELADAPEVHSERKALDDHIVVLTADGLAESRLSILTLLRESGYDYLLRNVEGVPFDESAELDPIHTNHVEVFDGSLADRSALFKRGNVLISMKNLNAIAIIDGSTQRIVWLWGPNNLVQQHQPQLLPNGNILIFDNGTDRSRIVELDPILRQIVWSYENGTDFFSEVMGSVQRLPNGNTLVTESVKGYVLEVDRSGEVVWKFANPMVDEEGKRSNIWRMTRLPESWQTVFHSTDPCAL